MGHCPSLYLIQSCEFDRVYKNPMKQGGRGIKFTKWRTIDMRNTLPEAKIQWSAYRYEAAKDPARLVKFRVRFKGQTVITHQGRVYERVTASGTNGRGEGWMRFVGEIA